MPTSAPIPRTTVVLIVLGLILLAAIAYLFFGKGGEGSAVSVSDVAVTEAELTFLNLTAQIEPVDFDTSILSDTRFLGLQDLRTAIVPEPSGRPDPFAPLSK